VAEEAAQSLRASDSLLKGKMVSGIEKKANGVEQEERPEAGFLEWRVRNGKSGKT
jgi:hypothetical protein